LGDIVKSYFDKWEERYREDGFGITNDEDEEEEESSTSSH
jgi:hypothetical protein